MNVKKCSFLGVILKGIWSFKNCKISQWVASANEFKSPIQKYFIQRAQFRGTVNRGRPLPFQYLELIICNLVREKSPNANKASIGNNDSSIEHVIV